jgi:mannose-6-phosphate isomerase-like protein (cupin superfamily)
MKEIDLSAVYLLLGGAGTAETVAGGDAFWKMPADELDRIAAEWLLTEFDFNEDWKTWEMHPHGDELVYLLSGAMDFILKKGEISETRELRGKGLIVVPRGAWHTARVLEPSRVLFVTFGKGTEIRPLDGE